MKPRKSLRAGLVAALVLAAAPTLPAEAEGLRLPALGLPAANEECSACHMPYSAALLPQRSWHALMADLGNHFGEDASLDADVAKEIETYLAANASDTGGRFRTVERGLADSETPLRISQLPIMTRVHYEVGSRWRKKVGSMARCEACHRGAENGYFMENE